MNNEMNAEERRGFERLVKMRRKHIESIEENEFGYDHISTRGTYSERSHFIYELLQNADDVHATWINFVLTEDKLEIYHNGDEFNLANVYGVTGIENSTKDGDWTKIGRFGIGFKSVFEVTDTPYIFSGKYHIRIDDFIVPYEEVNKNQRDKTLIRLPFNYSKLSPKRAFEIVSEKLENLDPKTLLFLKNIETVEWKILGSEGNYSREQERLEDSKQKIIKRYKSHDVKVVCLESSQVEKKERYLVLGKPIEIEIENEGTRKLLVEVAFKLNKGKEGNERIVDAEDSRLVVFFPTKELTSLKFLVQGPYTTTKNREGIPLKDNEENQIIIDKTGELVAESLPIIKDLDYLDTKFLCLLPIDQSIDHPIYTALYRSVKKKLLSEKLLPTSNGKYAKAENSAVSIEILMKILNTSDLSKLYSRNVWLDPNITEALREYLTSELGVKGVNFHNFINVLTREFLEGKKDLWFAKFYGELSERDELWKKEKSYHEDPKLWSKPIIKLENNELVIPFGAVKVHLPSDSSSEYRTVKTKLVEDEKSLKFLKGLGLSEPNVRTEVNELILPRYKRGEVDVTDKRYLRDFTKIVEVYNHYHREFHNDWYDTQYAKRRTLENLKKRLKDTPFILTLRNGTDESFFKTPKEVYVKNKELQDFFEGYQEVYFVYQGLLAKDESEKIRWFLKEMEIADNPRRVRVPGTLTSEERKELRGGGRRYAAEEREDDYEYEGLDNFIDREVTPEKSRLLWALLLDGISNTERFFEGTYYWTPQVNERSKGFPAKFLTTLKESNWLIDKNGELKKPSELTLSELSDGYEQEEGNASILINILQFKHEPHPEKLKIRTLERENDELKREKENLKQENNELKKNLEKYEDKKSREKWKPEVKPDEAVIEKGKIELRELPTPDPHPGRGGGKRPEIIDNDEPDEPVIDGKDKKEIGKCGEESAYISLKQDYEELGITKEISINSDTIFEVAVSGKEKIKIVWHNKNEDTGRGHDICIKQSGKETKYIEVKSTTLEDPKTIDVQETQWKMAKEKGASYSFYVVSNVGKEVVKVGALDDPYGQWEAGTLRAHPVRIKLPKDIQDDQVHRLLVTGE